MRAAASYITGVCLLGSIMFIGGAWTPADVARLVDVEVDSSHARFGLVAGLDAHVTTTTLFTRDLPPGCDIPRIGATCAVTAVAGGLDVPIEAPAPAVKPRAVLAAPPMRLVPRDVEVWRPLIESYFAPADVPRALAVIGCESSGDPNAKNPTSSASGLFQNLGRFWPERSVKAGVAGADIFDPVASTAVAAWLVYEGGGWSHWNPSRYCWG